MGWVAADIKCLNILFSANSRRQRSALLEIPARGGAEGAAEGVDEGAGRLIAQVERDRGHAAAVGQRAERGEQARLLPPGAGAHAGLVTEAPRQRAGADAERVGPGRQVAAIARVVERGAGEGQQPGM